MKTNISNVYAIGDIVGQPMLAHKAVHEAKVAAEVICGHKSGFDGAFCHFNSESSGLRQRWVGVDGEGDVIHITAHFNGEGGGKTEKELKTEGVEYEVGKFPWAASGRSLSIGRSEGVSKALTSYSTPSVLSSFSVLPVQATSGSV
jgi:dihydrolipoamide dehydrogenase